MVYIPTSIQRPIQIQQVVTVHYFEYSSNYAFVGESHDFWEFVYVDKGEIVVTAEDKQAFGRFMEALICTLPE